MFGKKTPKKAFEKCQLKQIEIDTTVRFNAILHCPQTEDEKISVESGNRDRDEYLHENPLSAKRQLAKYASELLCTACPYVDKSPVEVTIFRAEQAQADAQLLKAQAAKHTAEMEYQAALSLGQAEVDAITRRHITE